MALTNGLSNETYTIAEYYQALKLGSIEKRKCLNQKHFL